MSNLDGISILGRGSGFRDGVRVRLESDGNTLGNFETRFQGSSDLHVVFRVAGVSRPNGQFVSFERARKSLSVLQNISELQIEFLRATPGVIDLMAFQKLAT